MITFHLITGMSDDEKRRRAVREKDKGNEVVFPVFSTLARVLQW